MAFLPREFAVPAVVETARFRMRSITIHDAFKDYDAVMSSREHLWRRFGEVWGWPADDLTIEQNIVDLGWHQKEFQTRRSFAYTVVAPDESRVLGCVYILPTRKQGHDAEVFLWARQSELSGGLEHRLQAAVEGWLESHWPFRSPALPGRVIAWEQWRAIPDGPLP